MKHIGTQTLETGRLVLRRFTVTDADAMYHNWASDPEVTKFLTWPCHASLEVSAQCLADWEQQYAKPDYYQWAIVPKKLNVPIGSMAVIRVEQELEIAEVGYCIGKPWWRQGYTSEALSRVIAHLTGKIGFRRVEARNDPRNPNSSAVMRKCGMTYEGTLRQADRNNQGICDACVSSILSAEWRAQNRSLADQI